MFAAARSVARSSFATRSFSASASRAHDVSKLTLIGWLGKEPEIRSTKNGKEYIQYTVATTNYPPPPPNADGTRAPGQTTWHQVYSFHPGANNYLRTLNKGSRVFVEANFELREPSAGAEAGTAAAQRQIFLRHESIRVLAPGKNADHNNDEGSSSDI